jgi:hypothetical protein
MSGFVNLLIPLVRPLSGAGQNRPATIDVFENEQIAFGWEAGLHRRLPKEPDTECPPKHLSPNQNTVKVLTWGTAGAALVYVISEYGWLAAFF